MNMVPLAESRPIREAIVTAEVKRMVALVLDVSPKSLNLGTPIGSPAWEELHRHLGVAFHLMNTPASFTAPLTIRRIIQVVLTSTSPAYWGHWIATQAENLGVVLLAESEKQ